VRTILQSGGADVLPVVLVDGRLKWTGHYPTGEELAATLPAAAENACCPPADQAGDACCAPAAA